MINLYPRYLVKMLDRRPLLTGMTPSDSNKKSRHFGGTYQLHLQGNKTQSRNIPEHNILHLNQYLAYSVVRDKLLRIGARSFVRTEVILHVVQTGSTVRTPSCPMRTAPQPPDHSSQCSVDMKNVVFWDVTPCGSCKNGRIRGT
jgi:hypothetical protein